LADARPRPLIYIVRHGQTAWNAEGRLQGQAETDITELGRAQADANGAKLRSLIPEPEAFDFVASPMRRTRETMRRIRTAMGLDADAYRVDPRLVEVSFGDWQGFTFVELDAMTPGVTAQRSRDKWNFLPPGEGAESYQMLLERIVPVFEEFLQPTVCVTHGGVIRALFRHVTGLSMKEAARMPVPQDRVLRFEAGRLAWV
jgi:broad specificity phosphatase PhoE